MIGRCFKCLFQQCRSIKFKYFLAPTKTRDVRCKWYPQKISGYITAVVLLSDGNSSIDIDLIRKSWTSSSQKTYTCSWPDTWYNWGHSFIGSPNKYLHWILENQEWPFCICTDLARRLLWSSLAVFGVNGFLRNH